MQQMHPSAKASSDDALKQVLSLSARGAPPQQILQALAQVASHLNGPGTRSAIFTRDAPGLLRLRAAVGLTPAVLATLQTVPIGPDQLSSGRSAASGQPVIVEDIVQDESFARWKTLSLRNEICAAWSFPLLSRQGEVLGTLTLYPGTCGAPDERSRAEIAYFADVASLLIEREQLQEQSDRRRRLYETFLQNTADLAYVFDLEYRFVYANEAMLRVWGKSWDEAIGKTFAELGYDPQEAALHQRELERVTLTKKPVHGELPYRGQAGVRLYDYFFVPVLGPNGEVEAIAGSGRDITERRAFQEVLQASQQAREHELREAGKRKDEFLAMLAHELRNPLAPITCAAELLGMGVTPDQARDAVRIIQRQARHMTGLVDDLLDVSRVTRGLVRLRLQALDLADVARDAVEQVRPLLEERRHRIEVQIEAGAHPVRGDPMRLVQVVANLLNNAAKYTDEGGQIWLSLESGPEWVLLSVRDNGVGMSAELLGHAFEPFVQEQRSYHRAQGGLGLGLALVKSLVELHGGEVHAYSDGPGLGTQVSFHLPRLAEQLPQPPQPGREAAPTPRRGLRILVVDDEIDAARMLAQWLQAAGHTVRTQHDPLAALALAESWLPDLCLLDIGMPVMDGMQLARALRQHDSLAHCMLVAVTGYGGEAIAEQAAAAGFDLHLVKPVAPELLEAMLQDLQGR